MLRAGTTLRDGMGRDVGEGFRIGGHVHSRLIHVDVCMANTTTIL